MSQSESGSLSPDETSLDDFDNWFDTDLGMHSLPRFEEQPIQRPVEIEFHAPSPSDIVQARKYFKQYTPLPPEIIDMIFDLASYWASVTFTRSTPARAEGKWLENVMILRTMPLGLYCKDNTDSSYQIHDPTGPGGSTWAPPRGRCPFREVNFHIHSHDQGWCDYTDPNWGPYDGSDTWFDAYIEHPLVQQPDWTMLRIASEGTIAPEGFRWPNEYCTMPSLWSDSGDVALVCPAYHAQKDPWPHTDKATHLAHNPRANRTLKHHHITWNYLDDFGVQYDPDIGDRPSTGKLVRDIRIGDTVAVWARSRCQAWINHVQNVSITVSWAV